MDLEHDDGLFLRIIFLFYDFIFRIVTHFKRRSFTVRSWQFRETLDVTEEEWKLEKKHDKDETIVFDASTFDGNNTLCIAINITGDVMETVVHFVHGGKTLTSGLNQSRLSTDDDKTFIAGPLRLELRQAFHRWRVQYKGLMKDESNGEQVFVSLSGWWKALSDAKWRYNRLSSSSLRQTISDNPFCFIRNTRKAIQLFDTQDLVQWGELQCEISIGEGDKTEVRFRGLRSRLRDEVFNEQQLSVYIENGDRLLWSRRVTKDKTTISHGFACRGDQKIVPLQLFNEQSVIGINHGNKHFINFKQGSDEVSLSKKSTPYSFTVEFSTGLTVSFSQLKIDKSTYEGVSFLFCRQSPINPSPPPSLIPIPKYTAFGSERSLPVLLFSQRACMDSSITGGKASNLARLTSIANGFVVPRGLAVTVQAFERHVETHENIRVLIERLAQNGNSLDKCLELGKEIRDAFTSSKMDDRLVEEITTKLIQEVGEEVRLAVRSSAVGEDGSELSSAGQLESYMEVDIHSVPEKILLCWASNYRTEVITYRKQHGQPVTPPMGVVVQRMIENGVAGVMFTCDPVRIDPSRVVINAFKGKGEDIVSGLVTPDTVVLDKLTSTVISQPDPCALSTIASQNLLKAGQLLERTFGGPQDVEFIVEIETDRVNVVQSRDVTGRERESDFELKTEFNSATLSDKECFTLANVGEVIPVPLTPLFLSTAFKAYDLGIICNAEITKFVPRHCAFVFGMYNQRVLFNHGELFLRIWPLTERDRIAEISLGGQLLFDDDMMNWGKKRYTMHPLYPFYRLYIATKMVLVDADSVIKAAHEHEQIMGSMITGESIEDKINAFRKQRDIFSYMITEHAGESMFSAFTYLLIAILIRGSDRGDFTPDMISDIATLFSSGMNSGAISGDVPETIRKLAVALKEEGVTAGELEDEKKALELIKSHPKAGPIFNCFMETHGHRGPGELDFVCRGWSDQPELLVHTVKGMLASPDSVKTEVETTDLDTIVDSLKCRPAGIRRAFLKYLIKQTHRGVKLREECKNLLVKGTSYMRKNVHSIGDVLVDEGYLPDSNISLFFTVNELEEFVKTRSPRLLSRALRRRKIFPSFEGHRYEYVWQGNPKEIPPPSAEILHEKTLSGTTVCEGKVVARARVAKNIDEAQDTQPGEVLITTYTDICWSPLFPIVKGLVTEVGGLLSHGAVVAREYGLPSLIAVQHATDVFKTGDLVELNATRGTISKVSEASAQ